MFLRALALLPAPALALPAVAQSRLLVVLRNGEVRTFELSDVERIEFAGSALPGNLEPGRPVHDDPVGTWDRVDGQVLTIRPASRFVLQRGDGTTISRGRWDWSDGRILGAPGRPDIPRLLGEPADGRGTMRGRRRGRAPGPSRAPARDDDRHARAGPGRTDARRHEQPGRARLGPEAPVASRGPRAAARDRGSGQALPRPVRLLESIIET